MRKFEGFEELTFNNCSAVCTTDKIVEVGKNYCYYESMPTIICNVKCIEVSKQDDGGIELKLEIIEYVGGYQLPEGHVMDVSMRGGNIAFGGMWKLYNYGEYMNIT